MYADLHIHTYFSDGQLSPEQVVLEAKEKNVSLVCVSDHDTIGAHERFASACREHGLSYILGAELTCDYNGMTLHIHAYDCDFTNTLLLEAMNDTVRKMDAFGDGLIQKMSKDFPEVDPAEYKTYQRKLELGGWKSLDYLRAKGVIGNSGESWRDMAQYYKKYDCKPVSLISARNAIALIHGAGGKSVLAHPVVKLDTPECEKNLETLSSYGLDGIECYYPSQEKMTDMLVDFCRENGMLITAGCDYHGDFAKYIGEYEYNLGITKITQNMINLGDIRIYN